jgi:outer membrane protein assembly factor BamB
VGSEDDAGAIVVGSHLCFGGNKRPRVSCHPLDATRKPTEARSDGTESFRGGDLAAANGRLYQAYGGKAELIVLEFEPERGRLARRITLPLPGKGDVNPRALVAANGKLLIAYREGTSALTGGDTVVVDIARGEIVGKLDLPSVTSAALDASRPLFAGRQGDAPVIVQGDPDGAKKRWSYAGKQREFLAGIAEHGKSVAVLSSDGLLSILDAENGQLLREKRIQKSDDKAGSVAPLGDGEDLFVVTDRLYRLTPKLAVAAETRVDEYLFGNLVVVGNQLVAASHNSVFVFDKKTLALQQKLENREAWQFSGRLLRAPEGVIAVNQLRYNYDTLTHFVHFRPVATGSVDRSGLPPDAQLYLDGRPLLTAERVAHGQHEIDVLRRGFRPILLRLSVLASRATPVGPLDWKPLPASQPPRASWPKNVPLASLLATAPRRVTYPKDFVAYQMVNGGSRQASLAEKTGLSLLDAATGRVTGRRAYDDVLTDLDPQLPARVKVKTNLRPRVELGLLAPELNLLFLVTEGSIETQLAAFDASSGQKRWSTRLALGLPVMSSKRGGYFNATFWVGHGLFWHRDENTLYGRDLASGRLVFERRASGELRSELLFTDDSVIFIQGDRVERVQLFSGKTAWSLRLPNPSELYFTPDRAEIVVVSEPSVRRVSLDGKLLATSGALAGNVDDNAALPDDEHVFVCGHFRNKVYGLRRKDLSLAWTYLEPSGASPCPLAADDKDLLIGDGGTRLLLDKRTGRVRQKLTHAIPERLTPLFLQGNELCFPEHDQTLCLRP